jgi:colanic acid biosynthesis glycosyl transferase WcaI
VKILILGLNYAPEKVGVAIYTSGLAEFLRSRGHEVKVIAGQPYYPAWRIMEGYPAFWFSHCIEANVNVTRVPHYIPAQPTGAKRMLHHLSFALTGFLPALWQGVVWRPDMVFTVAPSMIAAPVAWLSAVFAGARSWLHVQDFEVETALATGLIGSKGRLAKLAGGFENRVLGLFNVVSAISPQMCAKLKEKGVPEKRIREFRNWADIGAIRPMETPSPYREEWGITTPHVALYSGNIGNKQGIEIIIEAARRLEGRTDLSFVICGEGSYREHLKSLAAGLSNIQFQDLQPKERLNELMGLASIHLLPQKADAADLVLPSKLTNMLASGRPVVATAAPGTGLAAEVEGCGLVTPPENSQAFAEGILKLVEEPDLALGCGHMARQRAMERWQNTTILEAVEAQFLASTKGGDFHAPTYNSMDETH